jgi:hypothetical protein
VVLLVLFLLSIVQSACRRLLVSIAVGSRSVVQSARRRLLAYLCRFVLPVVPDFVSVLLVQFMRFSLLLRRFLFSITPADTHLVHINVASLCCVASWDSFCILFVLFFGGTLSLSINRIVCSGINRCCCQACWLY